MSVPTLPKLHLIGPLDVVSLDEYVKIAATVSSQVPVAVHLRTPGVPPGEMLAAARQMRSRLGKGSLLIVNDRIDVALLANADGVQLGEASFTVNDARSLLDNHLIGRSVHDVQGAQDVSAARASYLLAGHVFSTPSKPGLEGRGIPWFTDVLASTPVPVIALGGIRVDRIQEVIGAGAWGVAMGREILGAANPATIAIRSTEQIALALKEETCVAAH